VTTEEIIAWLESHSPSNVAVWLLGTVAARMWQMRRRIIDLTARVAQLEEALADRDMAHGGVLKELEAERARAEALMTELDNLMRTIGGSL
jgi:hypothetical protein